MSDLTPEQRAFEKYWLKVNDDYAKGSLDVWLKRSDVWGDGGYMQPSVHADWEMFMAGVEWARKQK